MLTERYHVLGDHHGNRSPRADPHARGMVSGLSLNRTPDELAIAYLATVQAVAYGTRHIIEAMNSAPGGRYAIDTLFACGGGTKNPLFVQQHADITGCTLHLPREPEAVLLGSAVFSLGVFWLIRGALLQPLHEVTRRVERFAEGGELGPAPSFETSELRALFAALERARHLKVGS